MAEISVTWQVEYARFMSHPPLDTAHPTHPRLTVLSSSRRRRSGGGAWLQTSGAITVLKLIATGLGDAVLILSLHHKTVEEHFISTLHFSWPRVSCVSQSPVRGGRAIFASYKDSAGQIQKFAMRFPNASESQSFVKSLKESLKYVKTVGQLGINTTSHTRSQNGLTMYPSTDFEDHVYPTGNQDPVVQPLLDERVQYTSSEENRLLNDHRQVCPVLPPSCTGYCADSCTEPRQDSADLQKVTEEVDPKSHFAKYMNGSSFNAMLIKLDSVINNMGGDMAL